MAPTATVGPAALAGLPFLVLGSAVASSFAFRRQVSREVVALLAESAGARPTVLSDADLAGLPQPVQRWLRHAQVIGRERPVTVRLRQQGLFRQKQGQRWLPFMADQYFTTDPPGFVWFATIKLAPLLSIAGRDRYCDGKGNMDIRLLSLIPVANASGHEVDQGTLLRYLGETVWFPAAVVSPYITWQSIDARTARATMSFRGVSAGATFSFGEAGEVTDIVAERYFRHADGRFTPETWCALICEYGELNGVRMPTRAEAVWKLSAGDFSYIKLHVTEIAYNSPPGVLSA